MVQVDLAGSSLECIRLNDNDTSVYWLLSHSARGGRKAISGPCLPTLLCLNRGKLLFLCVDFKKPEVLVITQIDFLLR